MEGMIENMAMQFIACKRTKSPIGTPDIIAMQFIAWKPNGKIFKQLIAIKNK
jgi:hypothetical protein